MPIDLVRLKSRERHPGSLLSGQIAALAGDRAKVTLERERPWASITFSGTRHSFAVEWPDAVKPDAVKNLAKVLPVHEFAIPDYFVADILVTEEARALLLVEALTIIDPVENRSE